MQIRCPVCDHTREVDLTKVPPTAEFATCPKCRHRFRFRALDLADIEQAGTAPEPDPKHADVWDAVDSLHDRWQEKAPLPDRDGESADARHEDVDGGVPWENPRPLGYAQSFIRTAFWALFQPVGFFAVLSRRPALLPAMLFYCIFGVGQYILNGVWLHAFTGIDTVNEYLLAANGEAFVKYIDMYLQSYFAVGTLLTAPFTLVIQLFVTAGIIHFLLRLTEPHKADFALTFKVAAYASVGLTLVALPLVGVLLSTVGYFAYLLVGCRRAFRLSWPKTFLAMSPLFFLIFLVSSMQFGRLL